MVVGRTLRSIGRVDWMIAVYGAFTRGWVPATFGEHQAWACPRHWDEPGGGCPVVETAKKPQEDNTCHIHGESFTDPVKAADA